VIQNFSEPERDTVASWLVWVAVTSIALVLVGLIFAAPLSLKSDHSLFALPVYHAFSYACHQLPERSFYLAGHQLAVCARCTGLYLGFAAASLVYPLVRSLKRTDTPARRWLLLAGLPIAIDVTFDLLGVWKNTHLSRVATGLLLGSVAAFYVIPGLIDLLHFDWRSFRLNRVKDTSAVTPPASSSRVPVEPR